MHVVGPASKVASLFQSNLNVVTRANGRVDLVSATPIKAPAALQKEGVVIAAFTGIRQKRIQSLRVSAIQPENRNGPAGAYNYNDLKQAYNYPSYHRRSYRNKQRLDGTGVNVAIVMETDALNPDIAAMFNHGELPPRPRVFSRRRSNT